jgi:hypothetical protein
MVKRSQKVLTKKKKKKKKRKEKKRKIHRTIEIEH